MNHQKTDRRILLCATGMSPQVVTETLYALAVNPSHGKTPWIPTEVHIISTTLGAEQARLNLLSEHPGWFHKLCKDYALPPIKFTPNTIHCIQNSDGRDLDDIRTPADNESAANSIAELVRSLTQDENSTLHVSLAGGRKTMGYYTGYALSLYGRAQDRLSHILVNGAYENHPEFYYPTPYEEIIYTRGDKPQALNCADAVINLAEIPFVRLRDGLPDHLLAGKANFTEAVELTNKAQEPAIMRIDKSKNDRSVRVNDIPVRLTDTPFALLYWFAKRSQTDTPIIHWSEYEEWQDDYMSILNELYGPTDPIHTRTEEALYKDTDDRKKTVNKYFEPILNKLKKSLVRDLGQSLANRCLIKNRRGGGYHLPEDLAIIFE